MKKALAYWYGFLLILVFMTSCKSQKPVIIEKTKTVTETITERDTVFKIEKDSSFYKAFLECQDGKVVLKNPKSTSGNNLKAPVVKLDEKGVLTVDCEKEIQELKAKLKDKQKTTIETIEIPVEVPAKITGWQWFQIWCGRILLIGIIAFLIGFGFKKFIKP
jgi:hypothetical protein